VSGFTGKAPSQLMAHGHLEPLTRGFQRALPPRFSGQCSSFRFPADVGLALFSQGRHVSGRPPLL